MVLVLLTIPALSLLFLQNRQVQTMLSKYVAERLSEELMANISLSSINYSFFKMVQIQDLYLEDLHGDTLIYSELTKIRLKQIFRGRGGLEIRKISVENAGLNLVIDSNNVVNIKYFTDMLKKPHVPPERKNRLHIAKIEMKDGLAVRATGDDLAATVMGYNVMVGATTDMAQKAVTLAVLLEEEEIAPGASINLVSPTRPAVTNPQPEVEGSQEVTTETTGSG